MKLIKVLNAELLSTKQHFKIIPLPDVQVNKSCVIEVCHCAHSGAVGTSRYANSGSRVLGSEVVMKSLASLSKHLITSEVRATGLYSLRQAGWVFFGTGTMENF